MSPYLLLLRSVSLLLSIMYYNVLFGMHTAEVGEDPSYYLSCDSFTANKSITSTDTL